jgi:hypothetical protein
MAQPQRCLFCDEVIDEGKDNWKMVPASAKNFGDPIVLKPAHTDCYTAATENQPRRS